MKPSTRSAVLDDWHVRSRTWSTTSRNAIWTALRWTAHTDHASDSTTRLDQLDDPRRFVRDGDTVGVQSMDRMARNVDDMRALVRELAGRG